MSQKLKAALPPDLDLDSNYTIRFTAVDATTGAVVTAVNVSNATIIATNVVGGDLSSDLFNVEPLFTPVPVEGEA